MIPCVYLFALTLDNEKAKFTLCSVTQLEPWVLLRGFPASLELSRARSCLLWEAAPASQPALISRQDKEPAFLNALQKYLWGYPTPAQKHFVWISKMAG